MTENNGVMDNLVNESKFEASEDMFRRLFNDSHALMLIIDPLSGNIIDGNPSACMFYGYDHKQITQMKVSQINRLPLEQVHECIHQAVNEEQSHFVFQHQLANGDIRDVEVYTSPITVHGKQVLYSIIHDITLRKKAEEALAISEIRYRRIFENIQDAYFETWIDGEIIELSPSIRNMLQYTREELIGKKWVDGYVTVSDWEGMIDALLKASRINDFHLDLKDKNETLISCSVNAMLFIDDTGEMQHLIGSIRDISERKRFERQILQAKKEWENTFDAIQEIVVLQDNQRRITRVNRAATILFQKNYLEIIGKHCYELFLNRTSPCQDCSYDTNLWGKTPVTKEVRHPLLDKIFQITHFPIFTDNGEINGFVLVGKDITDQRHLEAQLRHAQKLEAIGTLAGGIAHDFNNILSSIIGYTELVLDDIPKPSLTHDNAQEILVATKRAAELVDRILTFSRKGEQKRTPLQVSPIVKETIKFLRASLPTTIDIRLEIAPNLPDIMADPTQIYQIIMNLCTNASHAMRKTGGLLDICISGEVVDHTILVRQGSLKPGNYLKISVHDTGHGIPNETIEKIFDPYFTTKEKGEGTGLGLSVVLGIVESHDGVIRVQSKVGYGSVFHVYIPFTDKPAIIEEQRGQDAPPSGKEKVLFVDDEKLIVKLANRTLSSLGYDVVSMTESPKALELFKANPAHFDLVVTDLTMPDMTGEDLARSIRQIRPDIPIVLCSGYSDWISEKTLKEIGIQSFLKKPFNRKGMAQAIRDALQNH